jgi:hypothetical protein
MKKTTLRIDREGRWFCQGEEITHRKTYLLYCKNLTRDPSGQIILKVGREQCPVEVEDAPFIVKTIGAQRSATGGIQEITVTLNDESSERLDPETLRIHSDNAPYCRVREGMFAARFSTQAYQLLFPFVEHNEKENRFFITIGGKEYNLLKIGKR